MSRKLRRSPLLLLLGIAVTLVGSVAVNQIRSLRRKGPLRSPETEVSSLASPEERHDYPAVARHDIVSVGAAIQRTANPDSGPLADDVGHHIALENLPPGESARRRAAEALEELEHSGPAPSTLTAAALQTVESLKRMPELGGNEFADFRCFGAGCTVSVIARDEGGGDAILRSETYNLWPGPKMRSGPIPYSSEKTKTVLIFYKLQDVGNSAHRER